MEKIAKVGFWLAVGFVSYPLVWCPLLVGCAPFNFLSAYLDLYAKYLRFVFKLFGID